MPKPASRYYLPISWSIAVVIVAALVAWLVVAMYSSWVSEEADRPFAAIDMDKERNRAPITSIIGTVTSVAGDSLMLTATPVNNPHLAREAVFTVQLTPQTLYSRSSAPASVPASAEGDLSAFYRFSSVNKTNLARGMKVNVRTGKAVNGKTEVEAESIEILETH
jgi:hypothetical protein